jgi:hypothetical protein
VELERHEQDGARWEVARRLPAPTLRPLLGQALEGWTLDGPHAASFHELPFPGIPLILNLGSPWLVEGASFDSFLAGLHTRPSRVTGGRAFSCLELRLTPLGARRLLGLPLHELANRTHALEELLPVWERSRRACDRRTPGTSASISSRPSSRSGWPTRRRLRASSPGPGASSYGAVDAYGSQRSRPIWAGARGA